MRFNRKYTRIIALFLLLEFSFSIFSPPLVMALTGGPSAPEFSSFTPVATTDMVNLFTGDFNYNLPVIDIPGAEGGGYALSLAYNSGNTSEQEATWVGFGWSLNPGAINRSLRGFPDDANGFTVDYYNKTRPNWTTGAGTSAGLELFSNDVPINISLSSSFRFNNYQGYTKSTGLGLSSKGISLNMNMDNDGVTWSADINPMKLLTDKKRTSSEYADNNPDSKAKIKVRLKSAKQYLTDAATSAISSSYGTSSFSEVVRPTSFTKYKGVSYNWTFSGQATPTQAPIGLQVGKQGFFSMQFNTYKNSLETYGYMHSDKAGAESMMDYYMEKGSAFDKRDYFIGMPFSNYDMFNLSGEGLSGGFRAYNPELAHYKPNEDVSKLKIRQIGIEYMVGLNLGVGVDLGIGSQKTKIAPWDVDNGGSFGNSANQLFRFTNDMGGTVSYTDNTNLESGGVQLLSSIPGTRKAKAIAPTGNNDGNFKLEAEQGRSSFTTPTHEANNPDQPITGFTVFNEQGFKYAYEQPVFVRNETNLSVDINQNDPKEWNYLAFRDLQLSDDGNGGYHIADEDLNTQLFSTAMGEIRKDKYAGNFLLTSIVTPDYVDKTDDGPSYGDFGGWTKFNYRKIYGEDQNEWYRYRSPYNGLLYQKNSISDTKDDTGSITTGEKEVLYLKTIETNTHIAYFVTNKSTNNIEILNGSGEERLDGIGAVSINSEDQAAKKSNNNKPVQGATRLEYLEKIVLFTKDDQGNPVHDQPLKVVRFAYDYSLVPNVPNNANSTYNYANNSPNNVQVNTGKLTLKKVWFEYGGVVSAKISPYEFGYNYKHSSEVTDEISPYFSEYDNLSDNKQNPIYTPYIMSPWGYPMANGKEQKEKDRPWIDQSYGVSGGDEPFDPASWQLKSVKLPSGGEIIVQYEQKDYAYVQDRTAMAMASITGNGAASGYESSPEYTINPEELGANANNVDEVQALINKINAHYLDQNGDTDRKIYFKFLYALKGGNPSLTNCKSEYITGYASFQKASIVEVNGENFIKIKLQNAGGERAPIPRTACYEFVSNVRQGKLDNNSCIEPDYEGAYDNAAANLADRSQNTIKEGDILKDIAFPSMKKMGSVVETLVNAVSPLDNKYDVCKVISPEHSYLKLPVLSAKKGGGVRVKKLLLYDLGIEAGDETVYGSEYLYVQEDGVTSSGVATTEPATAREENPLVTFLPKKKQSWYDRITAGEDKEQTEGPLGESLLPSPSIGHSRVITKNIHTGTTGTGFSIQEFYTVKDFAFDRSYGPVSSEEEPSDYDVSGMGVAKTDLESNKEQDWMHLPLGLITFSTSKVFTAQGFRFIINSMHGQVKKSSNYGGTYENSAADGYFVSFQEYDYYEPGEKVKMLKWDDQNNTFKEYYDVPGKEMDVAMETRRLKDETIDFSIELDISVGISFLPPIFVGIGSFSFEYSDKVIATHATTKVLRYPAIVKSVKSSQDGVVSTTENLAFGKATGQAILTKTTDSFHNLNLAGSPTPHNGSMYSLNIPAEWLYPEMGQKAVSVDNTNQLKAQTATLHTYGVAPDPNWLLNPTHLLSASVQTFSNDWSSSWTDAKIDDQYNSAAYQDKLNKIWRPSSSWVYKSDQEVSSADKKIYESGYFDIDQMFDWQDEFNQPDDNWIKTAEVTKYSPNGNALEEINALDIPSAALFGTQYGNHLPVMVAQNAAYNEIFFEDYENAGNENGISHSGKGAIQVEYGENILNNTIVTSHLIDKGGLFYTWLNFDTGAEEELLLASINGNDQSLQKVARTGAWTLYKAEIANNQFAEIGDGNPIDISIKSGNGSFSQIIYTDDVRFQPLDAEASCYVYDYTTFRLIAQYDSEHFGLYYQYNEEGQLIRKIIETEKGVKTIQETQYNTPKKPRL